MRWYKENRRALGHCGIARAITPSTTSHVSSDLTYHVLEVMSGFETSAKEGRHITIESNIGARSCLK